MKEIKTRKFWFLLLSISICISFSGFTMLNTFSSSSKAYAENFSDNSTESDEKTIEHTSHFYLPNFPFQLPLAISDGSTKNLEALVFKLPMCCTSPSTPPPDLT